VVAVDFVVFVAACLVLKEKLFQSGARPQEERP